MKRKEPLGSDCSDVGEIMCDCLYTSVYVRGTMCRGVYSLAWHRMVVRKDMTSCCQSSPTALVNIHRIEKLDVTALAE